ncbi:MAG: cation-translocating P-type ATPase [Desulfobacterales bacterium]|nr:cation-translocating P-type ATPase [Desulfobacterales bacterium]
MTTECCDLCGLPLKYGAVTAQISGKTLRFCCYGCRQVYIMIMESTDAADPAQFRETEIYQRCVAAGIIPGSLEDLEDRRGKEKRAPAAEKALDEDEPSAGSGDYLPLNLHVEGMWCPACAWVIEETLNKSKGIKAANCLFSMDRVKLDYDPVVTSPKRIMERVKKLGYQAMPPGDESSRKRSRKAFIRFGVSAFLTMNVMMLSFALYSGFFTDLPKAAIANISWPIVIMASIVFVYGGAPIHRKAIAGLRAAAPGMEALITIGAASAFFYSFYNWLQGSIHLYFDTASMLITLVLIGKAVESWTRDRVQAQLGSFFALQPKKARIISGSFPEGRYAAASALSEGDMFRVMADEVIAADGRIIEGAARVDESSLTGEARPVDKTAGDRVSSGTRVLSGDLKIRATAVGRDSMVGQLTAIMENALAGKTGLEDVTDRVLRFFVPGIILLALATGAVCLGFGLGVRESWIRAITVMVISCPCALGVAIPLARVAGISLAGRAGILVHEFSAFDRIDQINAVIFDKTGTLTKGVWELLEIDTPEGHSEASVLELAAGLEAYSTHYIGEAIVGAAREKGVTPAAANGAAETENGISGDISGRRVMIGAARFLADHIPDADIINKSRDFESGRAVSEVYMSVDGRIAAVFRFGDTLRASSAALVQALKNKNIAVSLISGDGGPATRRVARELGITDAHGGMRPEEKAEFVNSMKNKGFQVAMVGDGVNDLPALASADLGIAVHSGRQIGREASAITLMGNEPRQILYFYALAGNVTRTIRQNLIFSFIYNIVSIPIAMSGLLNPLVAVTAMMLSSLSVTGNTLRLSTRAAKHREKQQAEETKGEAVPAASFAGAGK